MDSAKTHIMLLFLPMFFANVMHMVIVKKNWFSPLAIPISVQHFGSSKTWRGFVVLGILSAIVSYFSNHYFGPFYFLDSQALWVGAGLGITYMCFELPNSFIKRRLGIKNGAQSMRFKYFQAFVDKSDSLIGILLYYKIVTQIPFSSVAILYLVSLSIHITVSYTLVMIKVKKSF